MKEESFEEWDADFLDQLIQVEELALSSSSTNPLLIPSQPTTTATAATTFSIQPPQQQHYHHNTCFSYSPPRELSQKPIDFHNNNNGLSFFTPPFSLPQQTHKDQEIDRLKRELGTVSKKLSDLEQECLQLRNERNRKEEEIKFVYSRTAEKDNSVHTNLECGVLTEKSHGATKQSRHAKALETEIGYPIRLATSSSKGIGVQTDKVGELSNLDLNGDLPSQENLSDKLLGIWSSASDQKLGRNLISKLFMACAVDFHFLFGHMSMNASSESGEFRLGESSSSAALQYHMHSFDVSEAAKISYLYSVLIKVSNGLLHLEAMLGPLIDLCRLENDAPFPSYETFGTKFCDPQHVCKKGFSDADIGLPFSCVNWVSLFELLHQIAVRKTQGRVRLEAISIMNVILLRTNAHAEREIFGQAPVFESIAQFLKREAGSYVQKESLDLLFLLLNCPKLLSVFHSGCKEGDIAANDANNASTRKGFSAILEGLADCIACSGNDIEDIQLRKRAVIMLAFLAASGKSGFEILVNHKLHGGKNFLMLILQVLISEMDVEMSVSSESAESIKARVLLMREVLILLNRLVSNPGYSAVVLQVLTASREMASLTIDIVTRLSRKDQILRLSDSITRQMRESEIVDLARVLKKRVFTYLGDTIP
ncbi:conserved hypothetical protein [Ricinus communis]|uniref:Uncharacterized protein n=1 Tax=Ricinus communis TaxID=3988 RepID=B9RZ30_RICCO|nr:conserved hypothetical protein [Ricinus communis]